ncbi:MAG: hypothetical protein EOP05_09380 [Proteobacteria bacterium]|nr:MAG: hypothetical protein EOP05_09380 [Pseudomonadota bacterium]
MDVFSHTSFNQFLEQKFEEKLRDDPTYTLRRFARDLEISPSRLSELLKGHAISVLNAASICDHFKLTGASKTFLISLAKRDTARTDSGRARAESRLQEFLLNNGRSLKPTIGLLEPVITLDERDLESAKAELETFSARFLAKYANSTSGKAYVVSLQMYEAPVSESNADPKS